MPRLPFGSDCARKTAARQAGGSRMFEDGEGPLDDEKYCFKAIPLHCSTR
ncbi:hypothetical protein [Thermincola ferriacetica]|nr:hypothetical protein [Thermincola ferriacetica]